MVVTIFISHARDYDTSNDIVQNLNILSVILRELWKTIYDVMKM